MADTLRMSFSLTAVEEVGAGNSQTHTVIDSVAQRTWGGSMNRVYNAGVDSDKICVWENSVVTVQDAALDFTNGLDASAWTEASDVTDGAIPSTAYVVAVEYVSTLGTVATVAVTLATEIIALLTVGESIVIPWHAGEATSSIGLTASAYSDGVHEATVNVMLAGT